MASYILCSACREAASKSDLTSRAAERLATCFYFHHLPHDVLLKLLARVPPNDVRAFAHVFPGGIASDTVLWRAFFVRTFGRIIPHRFVVAPRNGGTFLDWQSMYLAEEKQRVLRNSNININRNTPPPSSVPARITVTAQGNMHRIRSATADNGAAPIVVRGGIARFDWSNRR